MPEARTGSSEASAGNSSSGNPRKRQRTLVSCTECHRRKQKCDRQWPCGNCTSRSASHLCQYERRITRKDENLARKRGGTDTDDSTGDPGDDSDADLETMMMNSRSHASEFGYSRGVHNTSLNVLEKLDIGCDNQLHLVYSDRMFQFSNPNDLNTYNNYIRIIPARPFTNLLVQVFFTEINFLYGTLHQPMFTKILDEWWTLATTSTPVGDANSIYLSPLPAAKGFGNDPYLFKDIHFFPSLLLQVLSLAVQLLPREHHDFVSQIKLGMCETFHDLSVRFSNASCELASLLSGTCSLSLSRVQQPFLRATWLKNEGRMHEAWHCLGMAIRSAQEQGLHLENGSRNSSNLGSTLLRGMGNGVRLAAPSSMDEQLKMMWYRELEKRVWINLYSWDRYMSMLLGRPTMINDRHCTVTAPLDSELPADFTLHEPIPRGVMDPPTPFTQRILEYRICHLINELDELNQSFATTSTPDFVRLDDLHARLMGFTESFPPEFSITNRDTTYDNIRPFLAVQAALLKCVFYSVIVALHRPYLFLREKSRRDIVRASLIMLEAQDAIVKLLKEHHHRIYAICFFTFDPCVLLSAVVITNCSSLEQETLEEALVALRAGWERLRMLGANVKLAEKGAVVLRVLLRKVETVAEKLNERGGLDIGRGGVAGPDTSGGILSSCKSSKSPRSSTGTGTASTMRRSRGNTRGSPHSGRKSPSTQNYTLNHELRQGCGSPDHSISGYSSYQCSNPSEGERQSIHLNTQKVSESTFLEALNAASSFNAHHHQQQPQHHQHHHVPAAMPLEWDSTVLIGVPVSQMGIPPLSSTADPLVGVTTASVFDFGKPTDAGDGGFPGFFDSAGAFPMSAGISQYGAGGPNGNSGVHGLHSSDWLWQNLLGISDA